MLAQEEHPVAVHRSSVQASPASEQVEHTLHHTRWLGCMRMVGVWHFVCTSSSPLGRARGQAPSPGRTCSPPAPHTRCKSKIRHMNTKADLHGHDKGQLLVNQAHRRGAQRSGTAGGAGAPQPAGVAAGSPATPPTTAARARATEIADAGRSAICVASMEEAAALDWCAARGRQLRRAQERGRLT